MLQHRNPIVLVAQGLRVPESSSLGAVLARQRGSSGVAGFSALEEDGPVTCEAPAFLGKAARKESPGNKLQRAVRSRVMDGRSRTDASGTQKRPVTKVSPPKRRAVAEESRESGHS